MDLPASLCDGRYTLVEPLGAGGMATVYRAYDHRLKVWRALKLLAAEYGTKKKLRARFDAEAQTMAHLEHPNIVRVYDVGTEGDQPYIVMELCEGGSPVDWLDRHGPMPPRLAVGVVLGLCAGISAAHAAGVIHRDIKPHNILVTSKGACKVTDFGIAQISDSDMKSALTKTGSVMGTLGYMAPEQRTDAKNVDVRADVYAIGATLYTLLTNRTNMDLFAAEESDEVLADVHPALRPILLMAVQYKREQRYPDVASLTEALEQVIPDLPRDPPDTPFLAQPAPPAPPIPPLPTLVADPTPPEAHKLPAAPTLLPDAEPAPSTRARLKPRNTSPTPAPVERSLANLPFPKEEPRRPVRSDSDGGAEAAPVATRAAQMMSASETPDYVVAKPAEAGNRDYTIELAEGEKARRDGAAPGEEDDEDEGGGEKVGADGGEARDVLRFALQIVLAVLEALANPAKMLAGPLSIVAVIFLVVVWMGATSVNQAQTYAVQAQVAYGAALDQDIAPLVEILVAAGGAEHVINPLYEGFRDAKTDQARFDAGARLLETIKSQSAVPKVSAQINASGRRGEFDTHLRHLEAAQRERDTALQAWAEAAASTRGGWAVGCGVSEAPPPPPTR